MTNRAGAARPRYGVPVFAASPLAWLLDPLPVAAFYDDVYAVRPHHVHRGDPDYFAALPSGPGAVEVLLAALTPDPSGVHAVRGPEHRDTAAYRLGDGTLDVAAVRADYAAGYTVVLDNLERYVRPLTEFANAMERELNFATQVNAYLTPPHSTGFLPHYDHHDVLVLQVQGAKTWYLYGTDDADAVPPRLTFDHSAASPPASSSAPSMLSSLRSLVR